jgi:cytochrome c oxidase cbb3-type subunit 3
MSNPMQVPDHIPGRDDAVEIPIGPDGKPLDPLTNHEYDGIREYDNPTPGWWWLIFMVTVAFSAFYIVFWHVSAYGWSEQETWASAQRRDFVRVFGKVGTLEPKEDVILDAQTNEQFMTIARATFIGNCAACHASDGGGQVGPNLCDDSYKGNIKSVADIYNVITEGAAAGSMPAWNTRLSQNQRVILAAYVATLRGTTPASPKAAEGNVIPPFPKPTAKPAEGAAGSDKPDQQRADAR